MNADYFSEKFSDIKTHALRARFGVGKIFLLGCLLLCLPVSLSAETLAEYRADVKAAKLLIQNLLEPDIEDDSYDDFDKLERDSLKQIRARLPATEKIQWQNSSFETDNRWLSESLDKFERTPKTDARRWETLTAAAERLEAIEQKLDQIEAPSAAATTRTKDEDKQKLAEILRREEYQKPAEKEESFFQKMRRQFLEWLEKIFPRPAISPPETTGFQSFSFILQMLLYAVILGAIGFIVYRFAPFFAARWRGGEKSGKKERVILGERLAANETAANLFAEAETLARDGNLRDAIRKGYIALLCELSERKIIGLSRHKTNRDYLRDVRRRDELYQNMSGLTSRYERYWYGFDEAGEADWEKFRTDYQKTLGI